ncbi:MAG: DHH family phosphoesterase [Lachnospiraceae bacterium]|nr:DHH family phosphoesterase [Lachnospiraceae bacterium]
MSLSLSALTKYKDIVVQCHDNPDADALACGLTMKWYFKKQGIDARIIYSGEHRIQKTNLLKMIEQLKMDIEYVTELKSKPELLLCVDCQYGESNVTRFEAENIAVIDHHQVSGELPALSEVRSNYGSCSTVLYVLLRKEKISINEDPNIATALYYGLMTDTGCFEEISHPADRDLRDNAVFTQNKITVMRNSNLSKEELLIAGDALKKAVFSDTYTYGIVETRPCDPNILGIISDMLLEVDGVDTCLVYSVQKFGVKISVRSCTKEIKASELAACITEGYGGGGGHVIKAGGFLKRDLLERDMPYDRESIAELMNKRMLEYHRDSEVKYAGNKEIDVTDFKRYVKKEVHVGYVEAAKVVKSGNKQTIRTLEGDVDVKVDDDVIIILGVVGETYPISREKFERSYRLDDEPYVFPGEYPPAMVDTKNGERYELLPHVKSCVGGGGGGIYAKPLDHRIKIFTTWDPDNYYLGVKGDYLAVRTDDRKDFYIIAKDIFEKSYEEIK